MPPIQKFVVDKATNFLSTKTKMKANVGSVHIGFPKTIKFGGIYVEDLEEDTLFYCKQISINTDLIPLIRQKLNIDYLLIDGLIGNISRNPQDSSFNFSPILDAFSSNDSTIKVKSESKWAIGFDGLNLANVKLEYEDQIDSTSIHFSLGQLEIVANSADLIKKEIDLKYINFNRTSLALTIADQAKKELPEVKKPTEEISIPIDFKLGELNVENISFNLQFTSGKLGLSALLKEANIKPGLVDLAAQKITLDELIANEIDVALDINPVSNGEDSVDISRSESNTPLPNYTLGNFNWNFLVNHAEISNTSYHMDLNNETRLTSGMDYMHMDYSNFNVSADSIYFNRDATGASVTSFSAKEISGPQVLDIKGIFEMNNKEIVAQDIEFVTPRSNAKGSIRLSYPAMRLIGKEIQHIGIESNLEGSIHLSEIKPFTSLFDDYPILEEVERIEVNKFISEGVLGDLRIKAADIAFGESSFMSASADITGLPTLDLKISYKIDTLNTPYYDFIKFIPDTLLPSGITLPQTIALKSFGDTDLESANTVTDINTNLGSLHLEAQLIDDEINSVLKLKDLDLGVVLNDSIYGIVNLATNIEGELADNTIRKLHSDTQLESLDFNNYKYKNGNIIVNWTEDELGLDIILSDSSLIASIQGNIRSRDSIRHYTFSLNIEKSDLQKINLMKKFFSISGQIELDMDIKSRDEFNGLIQAKSIQLENDQKSFDIDTIRFESDITMDYTNFNFSSEVLNATLTGNTKLGELRDAFIDHLDLFIELPDSIVNDKNFEFEFDLELKNTDLFTKFLIEDLDEIQLDNCYAKYNDEADELEADVKIPKLNYGGLVFDDLMLNIDSKNDFANAYIKIRSLSNDFGIINNIELKSDFSPQNADLSFNIHDLADSLKYQLNSHLSYEDSIYKLILDADNTIIGYKKWDIPNDNFIHIQEGKISSQSTEMTNGIQKFWLETEENLIKINLNKFDLQNFTGILEHDSLGALIDGDINGFVDIVDPFSSLKINSEVDIPQLMILDEFLGDLHAQLKYNTHLPTEFSIRLQNEENFIYASGANSNSPDNQNTNIIVESDIRDASSFQPLLRNYIKDLNGGIKGRMSIIGANNNPSLNGNFTFNNLSLIINETNTQLKNKGQIFIEDNLLRFESFEIRDSLDNFFTVKGNIDLENINSPTYDLFLKTDEFLVINSKPTGDQLVFGTLDLGIDVRIVGKQSKLKVASEFNVNKGTKITYVMPGRDLELISDEGIVEFVDFQNQSYQMAEKLENQFVGDSIVALIEGIDFSSLLHVDPAAKFTIIVDPNSGDYTNFQFTGKLAYKYNDTQRGVLTGLVELEDGFYELSFYGLVKKRFNFDPGSTISWSGDVMDGQIDFAARHTVRTNSVGLVSNEISSYERAMYNQRLPYDVILRVREKISYPEISFEIDLPERNRSTYPTLDSKLNILNQSSMESERNKQVFALLVGGTFIPENPDVTEGSSSDNFATTAARNSVNSIMTQQLNKLTGQFIQGFDVDMGVNTFDDFAGGTAQTRTQLDVKVSKNLFNDRVSAEMESHIDLDGSVNQVAGQSTAGMTEFAVAYKLTETGNYRIKVFRENAFDIFDGEIQNSGIAFIFVREFDSFKKRKPLKSPEESFENEDIQNTNK